LTGLVYIATHPITAYRLMDGQLGFMRERGYDVTVITAPGTLLERTAQREGVRAVAVPMSRELSPLGDAVALARLTAVLRRLRPAIVNAGTPKAGLLGVTAARLTRVPVIVYLLRGLRFEGATGGRRLLLAACEHVAGTLCDRVFANGDSLRERFTALGCAPADKVWVPGSGSSNGVDVERYSTSPEVRERALGKRRDLGLPVDAIVVGFVGRLTRDKGIVELLSAFRNAADSEPRLRLLMVGDHDATDPLPDEVRATLRDDPRVVSTGFVDEPAEYYPLMDVFAFPSLREGFPNALLEAAAAGLPVVAFRAIGTVDAVVDGVTGRLLPAGDTAGLAAALVEYAQLPERARAQGEAGRLRVASSFRREVVWQSLHAEYQRLLGQIDSALIR
jgi:glycosyltransferase involved in cell wall biosynthesis